RNRSGGPIVIQPIESLLIQLEQSTSSPEDVLDAFEERLVRAVRFDFRVVLRQRAREVVEQLALLLAHLLRDADLRDHVQIAVASARDVRHALAADPESAARL